MANPIADTLEMLAAAGISDALTAGAAAVKERDELFAFVGLVDHLFIPIQCSVCAQAMQCSIEHAWANLYRPVYCSAKCYQIAELWPYKKADPNHWWPGHLVEKHARLLGNKYGGRDYWMGNLADGEGRLRL